MLFRNLPGPLKRLLLIGALFTLAIALSATFVSVFFWKQKQSLITIAFYTGIQFVMMPTMFWLARTLHPKRVEPFMRIGILLHIAFFGLVLWLGKNAHPYWLGVLLGSGQGFYYFAYNLLTLRIAKGQERVVFNSLVGTCNSLSNMLAPLLGGYVIAHLWPNIGYTVIFAASLGLFILTFAISMRMRGEVFEDKPAPLFQRHHPAWNRVLVGSIFQGIREGVFSFLPVILVFIATSNEASLGRFVALTAFVSTCTFFLLGKKLKQSWHNESMLIGSFFATGAISLFLIKINYVTILIYGLITALSTPLFAVPFGTRVFQVIDDADELYEREYIAERELMLNLGRVLSVGSFIFTYLYLHTKWLPVYMLLVGGMQILAVLIMRTVTIQRTRSKAR